MTKLIDKFVESELTVHASLKDNEREINEINEVNTMQKLILYDAKSKINTPQLKQ